MMKKKSKTKMDYSEKAACAAIKDAFKDYPEAQRTTLALLGEGGRSAIPSCADVTAYQHFRRALVVPLQHRAASGKEVRHAQMIDDVGLSKLGTVVLRLAALERQIKKVCELCQFEGLYTWRVRLLRQRVEGKVRYSLITIADIFCSGPPTLPSGVKIERKLRQAAKNGIGVPALVLQPYSAGSIEDLINRTFDPIDQVYELVDDEGSQFGRRKLVASKKRAPASVMLRLVEVLSQIDLASSFGAIGDGRALATGLRSTLAAFQKGRVDGEILLPSNFDAFAHWFSSGVLIGRHKMPVRFDRPGRATVAPLRKSSRNRAKRGPKKIAPWRTGRPKGNSGGAELLH